MDVIKYWLSDEKKWFQSNIKKRDEIDSEISSKFKSRLEVIENNTIVNLFSLNIIDIISSIIMLDQFSRHIYRSPSDENAKKITDNTKKATQLTLGVLNCLNHSYIIKLSNIPQHIICHNDEIESVFKNHEKYIMDITPELLTFLLMPLKHSDVVHHWSFIKGILIKFKYTNNPALFRFYKDTVKKVVLKNNCIEEAHVNLFNDNWDDITDFLPPSFEFISLKFKECINNHDLWINNPLVIIVKNFLDEFLSKQETNPMITISLSGGVDSMTLTFILALIQQTKISYPFTLQSTHLNYKNRDESDKEANFGAWFCNQLNIPIMVRTIHEIQRRDNNRDFYESLTRKLRFDLYNKLPTNFLQNNSFVVLGHNHDDIIENIWTNFAKGNYLFNLKKMQDVDLQENVMILRPLLNTKKDLIYAFSKEFGIAYLCNTTPEWSNRGKMRNVFLPAVDQQFPKSVQNIEYVADTFNEYGDFLNETLFMPILEQMVIEKPIYQIPIQKKHIKLGLHFWVTLFEHILHPINVKDPSRKSIINFLDRIRSSEGKNGQNYVKCNLSGDVSAYYLYDEETLKLHIL